MASETYPDGFTWSKSTRRYRDKATGRFVPGRSIQNLRDAFVASQEQFVTDLAASLADGMMLRRWEAEMWDRIKIAYDAEFLAGRGGRNAITNADRSAMARMLKKQRGFLRNFANDIAGGEMTEAAIANRSKLYVRSARQAFERGKARAWGIRLPAYPADGSSECMANDRCSWEIVDRPTKVDAYWRLSVAEHCSTCIDRASRWSPYTIQKD